jgi:hypothetical protein
MEETSVRALLSCAAKGDEPPLGSLVADSLSAGVRMRRRRTAMFAGGGLVIAALLAVGIPALSGTAAQPRSGTAAVAPAAGRTSSPSPAGAIGSRPHRPAVQPPAGYDLVTPSVPAQVSGGDQVPITRQAVGQLLLDQLPPGSTVVPGTLGATLHDAGMAAAQVDIRTSRGLGTMSVEMTKAHSGRVSCGKAGSSLACKSYTLPGGITVQESITGQHDSTAGHIPAYQLTVWVRRATGVTVMIEATNYSLSATTPTQHTWPGTTLTVRQAIRVAADPRWAWTMTSTFVQAARHLPLPAPQSKG